MSPSRLPVALRAFTEPTQPRTRPGKPRKRPEKWPSHILVFDTETTTDETQSLRVGVYRFARWDGATLRVLEEGFFFADNLAEVDPGGYSKLLAYVRRHPAKAEDRALKIMPASKFVEERFLEAAYRLGAMVVGFNLPFDLSRLAVDAGAARGRYHGGFSLLLRRYLDRSSGEWREHPYRPRVCVNHVNSKRAFIGLGRPAEVEPNTPMARDKYFRGRFLDLRTLAFGLTSRGHSLKSACEAFGCSELKSSTDEHGQITTSYLDYARQDVRATSELLVKLREEFDRHPIDLLPDRVSSPAAIAKGYHAAFGITPPLEKFSSVPREVLGYAMTAYYGGRAEVRIRRVEMPVTYCDFLSMYPTVNSLMGLWRLLIAGEVECVDATDEVREFLTGTTAEDCFRPETWRSLLAFALVEPNGDILPVRAEYGASGAHNIGVNPLTSEERFWYALPDVLASKLLTGRVPKVVRAIRLVPVGTEDGLHPLKLRGSVRIDPRAEDFFRTVIEQRKRIPNLDLSTSESARLGPFLKVIANSGSYGIFAEMNPETLKKGAKRDVEVYGLAEPFTEDCSKPESPGRFCFPLPPPASPQPPG